MSAGAFLYVSEAMRCDAFRCAIMGNEYTNEYTQQVPGKEKSPRTVEF